jgi:hydroxyacylglutathione hydrolase
MSQMIESFLRAIDASDFESRCANWSNGGRRAAERQRLKVRIGRRSLTRHPAETSLPARPRDVPLERKEGQAMIVEQIWTANSGRNFNYLIACAETGEALAVDPLDHEKCLAAAKAKGWKITQILNTHEHRDHTGGNQQVIAATKAPVLAHANAKDKIPEMSRGLRAGDVIKVGKTVELECLDTPGHTMSHICVRSHTDAPALFCGDTLFNAGAGNCHNGGHPNELYNTFVAQLAKLPEDTLIYPGHDYIARNLAFTLDREPDNAKAKSMLPQMERQDTSKALVTTLALEREINTFFRLTSPSVIRRLREAFPDLPDNPDSKTVFLRLRELRNRW